MEEKDKFADEKLTDDELDKVAGGHCYETSDDSSWLKVLGLLEESYAPAELFLHSGTEREEKVRAAYAKVGIGLVYHGGFVSSNGYYFGQQSLTQEEAWEVAKQQAKRLKLGIYSD